jgi:hypothetical protein
MPADAPLWVLQYQLLSIAVFALPFAMAKTSVHGAGTLQVSPAYNI